MEPQLGGTREVEGEGQTRAPRGHDLRLHETPRDSEPLPDPSRRRGAGRRLHIEVEAVGAGGEPLPDEDAGEKALTRSQEPPRPPGRPGRLRPVSTQGDPGGDDPATDG